MGCHVPVQACHLFSAVLEFFFCCQSFDSTEQFLTWREQNSCFSGVYICFDEMWTKCLAKRELKF